MSQNDEKKAKAEQSQAGGAKPDKAAASPRVSGSTASTPGTAKEATQPASVRPARTAVSDSATAPARPAAPVTSSRPQVPRARRMQLSLTRLEPWSVAKVTFLLAIAGGIIQVVAAALLWILLNAIGLFDNLTQVISRTGLDAGGFDLGQVMSLGTVLSSVTIFSIFEIVLVVVLVTIFAFLYNMVSSLVGGIHVTLGDD